MIVSSGIWIRSISLDEAMANRKVTPPSERFWRHVEMVTESGCWIWTGVTDHTGYGRFNLGHSTVAAHRFAYELFREPIRKGLTIDHLCRVKCCVNPDHLDQVSLRENILRSDSASARAARQTHCVNGHLFDEANTHITPLGSRCCRACRRNRHASEPYLAQRRKRRRERRLEQSAQ
jgi:hypothetical protein